MNKYERLKTELEEKGTGKMTCFGHSMEPILQTGATLTFIKRESYEVGDVVFSKVRGRYIDAHKITKKAEDGRCLISNNKGHDNGWTKTIYGKAVLAEYSNKKPTAL